MHQDVAKTINSIAACYSALGNSEKAVKMHEENYGKRQGKKEPE